MSSLSRQEPPWDTDPHPAIASALQLMLRQAQALERIADRIDSLTFDPADAEDGTWGPDPDASRGPELRVRRW